MPSPTACSGFGCSGKAPGVSGERSDLENRPWLGDESGGGLDHSKCVSRQPAGAPLRGYSGLVALLVNFLDCDLHGGCLEQGFGMLLPCLSRQAIKSFLVGAAEDEISGASILHVLWNRLKHELYVLLNQCVELRRVPSADWLVRIL